MAFIPSFDIKVTHQGTTYTFNGVNDLEIKRSVHTLGASAVIKVPVTAVIRQNEVKTYVETAKAIAPGDKVSIRLGYNGQLYREFSGYIKQLNLKTPLEIVCEDQFYVTRSQSITLDGKITVLEDIIKKMGLPIGYCVPLTIKNFVADNKPQSWVLGKLKTEYGLWIFFDMDGRIYLTEPYIVKGDRVRYRFRYNVINEDDLKYQRAEDIKLKIKAVCIYRDGEKVEATIGPEDGVEKTLYFYDVQDEKQLAVLAKAELERYRYDGYRGKITAFLQPYAAPSMIAVLEDPVYSERGGSYYIESTEVQFGVSKGGRRIVSIGMIV
jgi:hypothetical protein